MAYAAIPALLKIRFGTNEILTSLMLVYVAQLFLDYLARGPWRNPEGAQFPGQPSLRRRPAPADRSFGTNVRISIALRASSLVLVVGFLMRSTLTGFQVRVHRRRRRAPAPSPASAASA